MQNKRAILATYVLWLVGACDAQTTEEIQVPVLPQAAELQTIPASEHTLQVSSGAVEVWKVRFGFGPAMDAYGLDAAGQVTVHAELKGLASESVLIASTYPERTVVLLDMAGDTPSIQGSDSMAQLLEALTFDLTGQRPDGRRTWYKPWTWNYVCQAWSVAATFTCGATVAAFILDPTLVTGALLTTPCLAALTAAICACGGHDLAAKDCPCKLGFMSTSEILCEKAERCVWDDHEELCVPRSSSQDKVIVDPDRDHDGIPNEKDKCPDDAENKNGYEDADGCPDDLGRGALTDCGYCGYDTNCCNSSDYYASLSDAAKKLNPAKCVWDTSRGCVNPKTTTQVKPFPYPIK